MPEAVIVAATRSPIGRARKGSLASLRPDELAAQTIRAALDQVPQLDVRDIDDLQLGCALPEGYQGGNLARTVALRLGLDAVPAATVTRFCASSLETTRAAFHAIRSGEADVIISAGVESLSHLSGKLLPDEARNPYFAQAGERTARRAREEERTPWHDPREDGEVPDATSRWVRRPRTSPSCATSPAPPRTSTPSGPRTAPRRPWPAGSSPARSAP